MQKKIKLNSKSGSKHKIVSFRNEIQLFFMEDPFKVFSSSCKLRVDIIQVMSQFDCLV